MKVRVAKTQGQKEVGALVQTLPEKNSNWQLTSRGLNESFEGFHGVNAAGMEYSPRSHAERAEVSSGSGGGGGGSREPMRVV